MRGRLWCLRLVLLLVVSALVFSPLAVRGSSLSSQLVGWNHDPSTLMLPSSPAYPAVIAYRDIRMHIAEPSFEKSELLLGFANQDAAAINTMAQRQDFVSSASHSLNYQQTFDRCVGWLVIASERGNDVSYLLARVKNDHLAQQTALKQALIALPDWSRDGVEATRRHAAEVILEAVRLLEGSNAATLYHDTISSALPDLELPETTPAPTSPSVVVVAPLSVQAEGAPTEETSSPAAPSIVSLSADRSAVAFGDAVQVQCDLGGEASDDLSFSWWCSRGTLVATGTEATWTAPSRAGQYEINVTVSDVDGQRDSRSIEITVEADDAVPDEPNDEEDDGDNESTSSDPPASPEIASLSLSADHKYFEESLGGGYSILVSRSCTIECVVGDPAGVEFEWTATGGGTVKGSGDTVTLTVPATPGYVTVTVSTSNQRGDTDSASVTLYVSTCTYCF